MLRPVFSVAIITGTVLLAHFLNACGADEPEPAALDAGAKQQPSSPTDAGVRDAAASTTQTSDAAATGAEPRDASATSNEVADAASDATAQAASQPFVVCAGEPPIMKVRAPATNAEAEPDWSCFDAPEAGDVEAADAGQTAAPSPRTIQLRLGIGPLPDAPDLAQRLTMFTMGATVDVFFAASTLGKPTVTRVFDQSMVAIDVPQGTPTLSARIRPLDRAMAALSLVESREYGIPLPEPGAVAEATFTLRDSRKLAASLVLAGGQPDPAKAYLVALARDCRGRDVSGAQFELIDGATNAPLATDTGADNARSAYTRFALPDPTCTFTNAEQPAWMMVNAPVNATRDAKTHSYRLRLQGRMRASDRAPIVFGEAEVELLSDVITRIDSLPHAYR